MKRLGGTVALALMGVGPAVAARTDPYCAPLATALEAARSPAGFAAVTGADTGLYHETTLALPGAKLCATSPRERPAAWRCHLGTEDRYTIALDVHADRLRRIEACLGAGWKSERIQDQGYLRFDTISREGDATRIQVLTTTGPKHRLFVAVLAAGPE